MGQDWISKLRKLLEIIDTQIDDLECTEKGYEHFTYFDTIDVANAIMGAAWFMGEPGNYITRSHTFYDTPMGDSTLVHCLMSSGILGTVRLLAPHQSELLTLLNQDFGISQLVHDPSAYASQFYETVRLRDLMPRSRPPVKNMSHEGTMRYLKEHVPAAVNLFKVIELLRDLTWQARLARFCKRGITKFESQQYSYAELTKFSEFSTLRGYFQMHRPQRPVNNFADAMAIVILIDTVRGVNETGKKEIHSLFVSTSLIREALRETGLETELVIKAEDKNISVARSAEFYIFQAAFAPFKALSGSNVKKRHNNLLEELSEFRDKVRYILKSNETLIPELVHKITIKGQTVASILEDIRAYSFYANVWVPYAWTNYTKNLDEYLIKKANLIDTQGFKMAVAANLAQLQDRLTANVREYKYCLSLYSGIEGHASMLRERNKNHARLVEDPFYTFGVIRFPVSKWVAKRFNELMAAFLAMDESDNVSAVNALVENIISYKQGKLDDKVQQHASLLILWTLEMRDELVSIVSDWQKNHEDDGPVIAMYAAAAFATNHDVDKAWKAVAKLRRLYEASKGREIRSELAICLGYLYFHYWKCRRYVAAWRPQPDIKPMGSREDGVRIIDKSVEYALEAFRNIANYDKKRLYALNQALYYCVEGGEDKWNDKILEMSSMLAAYKTHRNLWQWRYDDTLARYDYRMATYASSKRDWKILMGMANSQIEEAIAESWEDGDNRTIRTAIQTALVGGFKRKTP